MLLNYPSQTKTTLASVFLDALVEVHGVAWEVGNKKLQYQLYLGSLVVEV